ncbi:MAG: hypothetical protein JSR78_05660 [Proteobacteria bacterium]|nr:hypothetical protein [Pseudomonadota bacterium]
MTPIASRLSLAISLVACHAFQALADDTLPLTSLDARLPAFVPNTGRGNFTTALNDNRESTTAARRAAEALSAKFSDVTTNSISEVDALATTAPAPTAAANPAPAPLASAGPVAEIDPPHIVTTTTSRSFMLTSRQADGDSKTRASSRRRSTKTTGKRHGVPNTAVVAHVGEAGDRAEDGQRVSRKDLSAIGTKVGFLDLLTNPSLWPSPFGQKP